MTDNVTDYTIDRLYKKFVSNYTIDRLDHLLSILSILSIVSFDTYFLYKLSIV